MGKDEEKLRTGKKGRGDEERWEGCRGGSGNVVWTRCVMTAVCCLGKSVRGTLGKYRF